MIQHAPAAKVHGHLAISEKTLLSKLHYWRGPVKHGAWLPSTQLSAPWRLIGQLSGGICDNFKENVMEQTEV